MRHADPRLEKLLGGAELAGLRRRLRRHYEREPVDRPALELRLGALSAVEREAMAQLTGQPPREAKSIQVNLAALDALLRRAGIAATLREALEQLDGPLVHRATAVAAEQARWAAVLRGQHHPALVGLLQTPSAFGLLKRLARQDADAAATLLSLATTVLHRLPANGLARAQLAAESLGDAHALDAGQPTATLVLAAWRWIERDRPFAALPAEANEAVVAPTPAEPAADERARDVWARAGVLVNELARPALALNLPVQADAGLAFRPFVPGEPAYLSLRLLLRSPLPWAVAGRDVFVCENPNLLAIAADRLGAECSPLVCTEGMPAAAQRTLLTQLVEAGARLRYHGDFDWPGLQIANFVHRTWGATPWRMGAADYESAAALAPHDRADLPDSSVQASWDAELGTAMRLRRVGLAEEAVSAMLIEDLRAGSCGRSLPGLPPHAGASRV